MRSIVWLFIDSLSSLYINADTMPFLNSQLEQSLYFTQHIVTTPYTMGAWYSQITGRYVQHNGYTSFSLAQNNDAFFRAGHQAQSNIIQEFKKAGYYTVIDSCYADFLDWLRGWSESHKIYDTALDKRKLERPKEPFLWVYHHPGIHHTTTGPNRDKLLRRDVFYKILREQDVKIKDFMECYTGNEDIIVFTSDHGITWVPTVEEHHGASLYEGCIRTLFAIRGLEVRRIDMMTRSIDVGPTLLDLIGKGMNDTDSVDVIGKGLHDTDGISLIPHLDNMPRLEAVLETGPCWQTPDFHSRFGIRDNYCKYCFTWGRESLHKVDEIFSDPEFIADDAVEIKDSELTRYYRGKLIDYLYRYDLEMQEQKLREVARSAECDLAVH